MAYICLDCYEIFNDENIIKTKYDYDTEIFCPKRNCQGNVVDIDELLLLSIKILNKKGELSSDEFEIVKKHTILGYELVKDINEIDNDIKLAILLHHERMDGSGYPYHYNQDDKDLNIYSRIVALADVFDAMTTDRVYKKRSTPFEVFEMFQTVGISMYDTKIMNLLINKLASYLVGSKVLLSNGSVGEIVYIPLQNVTKPIIKVSSCYIDLSQSDSVKISSMM
jgi:HD-GYP domain-containing protein (c-di-GMP phosphodiesterase class II)